MELARSELGKAARVVAHEPRGRRAALAALGGAAIAFLIPSGGPARKRRKKKQQQSTLELAFACPDPVDTYFGFGGGERIGQLFTATRSGMIRQVRFEIFKDEVSPPGDWVVHLVKRGGAAPEHGPLPVLAAGTVPDETVPNGFSTLTANFTGARLEAGVEYRVVLSRPDSNTFGLRYSSSDVCNGQMTGSSGGNPFVETATQDVVVSVFVA